MNFEQAIKIYLDDRLSDGYSRKLKKEESLLRVINNYLGGVNLENFTNDMCEKLFKKLRNNYSDSSIALFYSFIRKLSIEVGIPLKVTKWPKTKMHFNGSVMTEQDRKTLLADDYAMKPVIRFALFTGLRRINIVNLKWDHCDFIRNQITIPAEQMKSGRPHVMAMLPQVKDLLLSLANESEYVFLDESGSPMTEDQLSMRWLRGQKNLNLSQHYRFHDLRHSCATVLIENGVPINVVADYLNHANIQTTRRYLHVSTKKQSEVLAGVQF